MGTWQQAGRILQALREGCGWSVPMLAVELEAQARVIGRPLTNRESLVRRIYDWEAGGHRPRDYYICSSWSMRPKGNWPHVPSSTGPSWTG